MTNKDNNVITLNKKTCPSSEELSDYFIDNKNHQHIQEHIAHCRDCHEIIKAIAPMREFELDVNKGLLNTEQSKYKSRILSIAASIFIVSGFVLLMINNSNNQINVNLQSLSVQRGATANYDINPSNKATLSVAPDRFTFQNTKQSFVLIELFDENLSVIWQSEGTITEQIMIPKDVQNQLTGNTYMWKINMITGVEKQSSPMFHFYINGTKK